MPVDQPVVDARARGDVTDGGCRGSTFGEQVGGRLQNRRNDLSPAQGCTGPRRVGSCTSCSHMTTVPARSLRSADLPGGRTLPVATTPYQYGRFIGRVGGLAVALGIGAAIANSPAIAAADDGQSSGSQAASSTSGSADRDRRPARPRSRRLHRSRRTRVPRRHQLMTPTNRPPPRRNPPQRTGMRHRAWTARPTRRRSQQSGRRP